MIAVLISFLLILSTTLAFADVVIPLDILKSVYINNPELASSKARANSEDAAISSKYFLTNPRVGIMRESNMTAEQRVMGDMQAWTLSQEIMFPTKYFSMGAMQSSRAEASKEEYLDKKLEIRQKALSLYYEYYTANRILALLEAQRETLREIARIVESRRATGSAPQQDEMKAHVEQTKIENEILLQTQEVVTTRTSLNALLNRDSESDLTLPKGDLKPPKIIISPSKMKDIAQKKSKIIAVQNAWFSEAQTNKSLAMQSYLPDFMLSYKRPFGANVPDNAYAFGIEITIPFWFFAKQTSEVSQATAKSMEAEKRLEQTKRNVESATKSLSTKTETLSKLLKIYETALIPQSTSALNSSRAAYRAGRVGFQELLDSERSLYSVRIDYYKNLARFVDALTSLERTIGASVSDLPTEGAEL
ncbi:MAG: TolC family protein [Oligoflexia bacterium]|nr:TolC family protein [Oligoflexia bacterium]